MPRNNYIPCSVLLFSCKSVGINYSFLGSHSLVYMDLLLCSLDFQFLDLFDTSMSDGHTAELLP